MRSRSPRRHPAGVGGERRDRHPGEQRPVRLAGHRRPRPLDSLLRGFPIGYLIAWRNPDVKLKDGSRSQGKRILIDGQQRVTTLMAVVPRREW